jgi:hypothetical protein
MLKSKKSKVLAVLVIISIILIGVTIPIALIGLTITSSDEYSVEKATSSPPIPVWNKTLQSNLILTDFAGIAIDKNESIYLIYQKDTSNSYISKYDTNGNLEWSHIINVYALFDIAIDKQEKYVYATGSNKSGLSDKLALGKWDVNGTNIWLKTWDIFSNIAASIGYGIEILDNNRIFIVGSSQEIAVTPIDSTFLAEFNSSGYHQWYLLDNFTSSSHSRGQSIKIFNNSIYVCGYIIKPTTQYDSIVAKYDITGNRQWFTTWAVNGFEVAYDLDVDEDDNVYIVGDIFGGVIWMTVKLNSSGDHIWNVSHNTASNFDRGRSLIYIDQKIFVAGLSGGAFGKNRTLLCYNKSGNLLWNYNLTSSGATGSEKYLAMVFSKDRNLYLIGQNRSSTSVQFSSFISKLRFLYSPILNGSVDPVSGVITDNYTFSLNYIELTNESPAYVNVTINDTTYSMVKNNISNNNYVDGVLYIYNATLVRGLHKFFFEASDGTNISRTDNLTVLVSNLNPDLLNPTVSPEDGVENTIFTFKVIYVDLENDTPTQIQVKIDNILHNMTKENLSDNNYIDGVLYTFALSVGQSGDHNYSFIASDGIGITQTIIYSFTVQESMNLWWILWIIIPVGVAVVVVLFWWPGVVVKRVKRSKVRFDF